MNSEDGQAPNPLFTLRSRVTRDVDELIGLCKGMVADGSVCEAEAHFLLGWLERNRDARDVWPASVLFPRISSMLSDRRLQDDEEKELLDLLISVSGGNPAQLSASSLSTSMPLTRPEPPIEFSGRKFCLTGKFLLGTRKQCEQVVSGRGGLIEHAVTGSLDYLVVGLIGSRDWVHSTFGRKIEKAVELRNSGAVVAIVAEDHFSKYLGHTS